jgi:hypothetical protein
MNLASNEHIQQILRKFKLKITCGYENTNVLFNRYKDSKHCTSIIELIF